MLAQSVALLILLSYLLTSGATPAYAPTCKFPVLESGYELWSNAATWKNMFSGIPGTGALKGAIVTIPCGKKVMLDVKNIELTTLDIQGALKVSDDRKGQYNVSADRIIVQGQFKIGSPRTPFRTKIVFTLTNTDRKMYYITRPTIQSAMLYQTSSPVNLGEKVFAVVGGQVQFYGIGSDVPGWAMLAQDAMAGANFLIVRGKVAKWPVGAMVGIATSKPLDIDGKQNEYAQIVSVKPMGGMRMQIVLDRQLKYWHGCTRIPIDNGRKYADQCVAVALLTRNIVIKGSPDSFIGGHFIVAFTATPQHIQGVEFTEMGQQGRMGRYPAHFHMGIKGAGSKLVKNSAHTCKQRCYVIHGTLDVYLFDNVCFKSTGVGISVEDGYENNTIIDRNFISGIAVPRRMIDASKEPSPPSIPDDTASCIWTKNPTTVITNNFVNAAFVGIWHDHSPRVVGPCFLIEGAKQIRPSEMMMARFHGNTACVTRVCVRVYPFYTSPMGAAPTISSLNAWSCASKAMEFREVHGMTIKDSTFTSFLKGLVFTASSEIKVVNSIIVTDFVDKVPATLPCTIKPSNHDYWYRMGLWINTEVPIDYGVQIGVSVKGTFFGGFIFDCEKPAAAIGVITIDPLVKRKSDRMFIASNTVSKISLDSVSTAFYFTPRISSIYRHPTYSPYTHTLQILDNTAVTGRPGAVIAEEYFTKMWTQGVNGPIAPFPSNCYRVPKVIQSVFCAGACMRSVMIAWPGTCAPGTVIGYLTRKSDGAVATLRAYRVDGSGLVTNVLNLMAGQYDLRRIISAYHEPTITNMDQGGCGARVYINVL